MLKPYVNAKAVTHTATAHTAKPSPSPSRSLLPSFLPPQLAEQIVEPAARQMLMSLRRIPVRIAELGDAAVGTAIAGPTHEQLAAYPADAPVVVMLHGFDSSLLEFRRLQPLLARRTPAYAIDLLGWGFSDSARFVADESLVAGPAMKRAHLAAWMEQELAGREVVLLGASLGGAAALDFALHRPQAVSKLVLVDAQAFIDGIGPASRLPRWAAKIGIQILRTEYLRQAANRMSYFNKEQYATADAMRVGRLHTSMPGWQDAIASFMKSGGYRGIAPRIAEVKVPTLVLWGRNDEILPPVNATQFAEVLPNSKLEWVEECGHVPHLEQPERTAQLILDFIGLTSGVGCDESQRILSNP